MQIQKRGTQMDCHAMKQLSTTHRSVERALEILSAFTPHNPPMGTVELSAMLGVHPSTVSRLLRVLTLHGFLQHDAITKKYILGKSSADLGRAVLQSLSGHLVSIAQPFIDDLRNCTGETAALEIMSGDSTILAYMARGRRLLQVSFNLGDRLPVHVAAGAKAVLAFSPPEKVNSLLKGNLERFTPHTIRDPKALMRQLGEIREHGIAFDRGERDIDVHAIAAPIFNHRKRPVAAVVLSFPANRAQALNQSKLISRLKNSAKRISTHLLYSDEDE
jgi:IclR family KDG regulon transcriptional repressor